MKITIKTDPETLFLLFTIIKQSAFSKIVNRREGKARQSMHLELFQIFSTRCIGYTSNPNGKVRTLSLRYHLANELYDLSWNAMNYGEFGRYERNKLEIFKNQMYSQLL